MAFYDNWGKGVKWLLGITTGGIGNLLLKTVNNMVGAVQDMSNQAKSDNQDFLDNLSGNTDDVVQALADTYNSSSENPYLAYRNGSSMPDFTSDADNPWQSWLNSKTGAGITANERIKMMYQTWERQQAENFNHNEAVDARNYEMYMAQNKYQMETQSMQNAGVNPAMVYGSGNLVPTAATGASGSISPQSAPSSPSTGSLSGLIDILSTVMRLPLEMKQINADIAARKADAQRAADEGWAARENAVTNRMNAGTQKGELGVHEREVAVREGELQVKKELKDNDIRLTDEQIRLMTEQRLNVAEATKYVSKNYDVAVKNANTVEKQAIAAMRQADAAVQNASTNDYLSTYQTDMLYSQRLGQDIMNGKSDLELKYLPEKIQAEIAEFKARGFYFNEQGKLANKNQALVTAQTVRQYELMVTDVANCVVNVAGAVATGGLSGAMKGGSTSVTYDPAPAYGAYGTYQDVGTTYWYEH